MPVKNDRWITRMAREKAMIDPFEERQVREGVISYGVSSYGYDIRVADEFRIFTNVNTSIVDPKQFDPDSLVEVEGDVLHHPAQQLRPRSHRRVSPDTAQHHHRLRRQEHLRALRDHRQRHAVRAGVGRLCHTGDLEHHPAPGEGVRKRGDRSGPLPRGRRGVRNLLRGQEGQVPGTDRSRFAATLT